MNKIPVIELKAGMKFNEPVFIDDDNILVPSQVEIRQKDIDRLLKWGVDSVSTDGAAITEASQLQEAANTVQQAMDADTASDQRKLYRTSITQTNRIFSEVGFNRTVNHQEIDAIVEKLISTTKESSEEMLAFVLKDEKSQSSIGLGAVNTVVLAVLVGVSLKMDEQRLSNLATAALLHDIGMARIPPGIVNKTSNLSADEIKAIRAHPLFSYQIIVKEIGYPEEVGMIALQHHERWDGKGYPRKMADKQIAVEARIITVADSFEAMVKEKPYRNSLIAYSAMRQLLQDASSHFDPEVLKVFVKSLGIYPLGSYVILSNGTIGRVIKINEDAPLRPAIQLLVDKTGKKLSAEGNVVLDLKKETGVFIAQAVDPKTIAAKKTI